MALILIVDDDLDILKTLNRDLTKEGYQVNCVTNANAALASSLDRQPDLVLLDIALPDMDGIELCHCMRANPTTATTPILFTTVSNDMASKIAAYDAGADDYLEKPFALQELNLRVKALLARDGANSRFHQVKRKP